MQFLSDVFITCPDCGGRRFKKEVLEVPFQGKNIHEILSMTVDQALSFFRAYHRVVEPLEPLKLVGLGYMRLGQPLNTLSGGEAQRLKLSRHIRSYESGHSLFIFDEPTTGLHFEDIRILLEALHHLTLEGHTVFVIEHNMDVIKTADWVIDLGPEGGEGGGQVVVAGTPEAVAQDPRSHTGGFLRRYLEGKGHLGTRNSERGTRSEEISQFQGFRVAESSLVTPSYAPLPIGSAIEVKGARVHNLKDLHVLDPPTKDGCRYRGFRVRKIQPYL